VGTDEDSYTAFVRDVQDRVRHGLVAGFGVEIGREAAEEALIYAWGHWDRISHMSNRAGYVFRVGHRMAQKMAKKERRTAVLPDLPAVSNPLEIEPDLPAALSALSPRQRMVVVLVYGFGVSQREAGGLLGIGRTSVQKHLERGLSRLRLELGVKNR
jgi:RNA polymerase sigma factor (sigma-70 family)